MKCFRVLLVPVDWLLMDGCIFCIKRASVMDNLLWLNSVNNIFVLLTRSSLVRGMLWLAIVHVVLGLRWQGAWSDVVRG